MKKELTIGLLAVALTIGLASTVTAQDVEDQDTSVEVNVSETTQIDVRPSSLGYDSVDPGASRSSSESGYEHVDIENIGSVNIEEIHAEADMPLDQPFGIEGNAHNTTNFVTISTQTVAQNPSNYAAGVSEVNESHYVNRVEFIEEFPPEYIETDASEDPSSVTNANGVTLDNPDNAEVGRIRAGGAEYFFVVYYNDGPTSPGEETALRLGTAPHTSTQLGSTDFTNSGEDEWVQYNISQAQTSDHYGIVPGQEIVAFDPDAGSNDYNGGNLLDTTDGSAVASDSDGRASLSEDEVRNYNLYTHVDDDSSFTNHIVRTKFNVEVPSPDKSSRVGRTTTQDQEPIFSASSANNQLQPGENFPVNFGIEVPQGVDSNNLETSTVSFYASAESSDFFN